MNFNETIGQDKLILVDFFATWCGPCQAMEPVFVDLKKRVGEKATIIKVDVDKNVAAARAFQIRSIPTTILFKKGEILWRHTGMMTAHDLEKVILQKSAASVQ